MDAMTNLCPHPRKYMTMNTLICNGRGRWQPMGRWPNIFMNIAIPECHSFSHTQTKPNKGHRTRFSCVAYVKKQADACKELSNHSTKETGYIRP
jgi:hypothetical protein